MSQPEWDETPVTINMIEALIDAHPDHRVTGHMTDSGKSMRLIEFPDSDGEFREGTPGDFVEWVSELE